MRRPRPKEVFEEMTSAERSADSRPEVAERITITLVSKVSRELQKLKERTGMSKTDLANRAISMYEFIEGQLAADKELVVRDPETGKEQTIRIF